MVFTISDPRMVVRTNDELLAEETLRRGDHGHFDAKLIRRMSGVLDIEVFLKVQFYFIDGMAFRFRNGGDPEWSVQEKHTFIRGWHSAVRAAWNRANVGRVATADGSPTAQIGVRRSLPYPVNVTFNFLLQEAGWMWDHFEIDVHKVPEGDAHQHSSHVGNYPTFSNAIGADADSEISSSDLTPRNMQGRISTKNSKPGMIAAVHEFGHMIGLPDEYKEANNGSPHVHDLDSIMNRGAVIRPRHYTLLLSWAKSKLRTTTA